MNRSERAAVAAETIQIGVLGVYVDANSETFNIVNAVRDCIQKTEIINPDIFDKDKDIERNVSSDIGKAKIEIVDETTLDAANSARAFYDVVPTILNFASAKHPGGGFQGGSLAQEEDIAYRSCLFTALSSRSEYYKESLNNLNQGLYFDKIIYTEGLVIIRDADYSLSAAWACNWITAPAPNRGAALSNGIAEDEITETMSGRIENILKLAIAKGNETIILGAFGCGVFKNNPQSVAKQFRTLLIDESYDTKFRHVIFAIPGKESENHKAFENAFGELAVLGVNQYETKT